MVTFVSPIIDPDSGLGRLDVMLENRNLEIQSGIICFWSEAATRNAREAKKTEPTPLLFEARENQGGVHFNLQDR